MNSTQLLNLLTTSPKTSFKDIPNLICDQGIYGWFENDKLVYVGKSKPKKNQTNRLVGRLLEHCTGNSCVSSFVNLLRVHRDLSVRPKDLEKNPGINPILVEQKKVLEYMGKNLSVVVIDCDPDQYLLDVNQKPEQYLFGYFENSKEVKLWNNPNKK